MMKTGLLAAAALLTVGAAAVLAPAASTPAGPEAPVAIPVTANGHWEVSEGAQNRPAFAREPVLRYEARVFPRLSLNLVRFRCAFPGSMRVEVTGLLPAQRFPQPAVTVRIGEASWSATPNAVYHGRSQPHAGPNIRLEKFANLSWPGHPAYAGLTFREQDPRLLAALAPGAPVRVVFDGQERSFPAIPVELAGRFVRACQAAALPSLAAR